MPVKKMLTKKEEAALKTASHFEGWSRVIHESMEDSRQKKQKYIDEMTVADLCALAGEHLEGVIENLSFKGYKTKFNRFLIISSLEDALKMIKKKG